ncbi:cytochrome P450 [Salinispora arenicola]|uniref:cytochrome P450 n=1 Tax=Salinispora arenicola TaxID=168697 RepID=UPI0027DB88E2|nr:cytochrome P450 [Salinispora arenicola]
MLINYAAAGRDPERYGDAAAEFDITRADKANLSFGYGRHRCLGPALATMEAMVCCRRCLIGSRTSRWPFRPTNSSHRARSFLTVTRKFRCCCGS